MNRVAAPRIFPLHKPRGGAASTVAAAGEPTVFDLLPEEQRAWFSVGRLDKVSEGEAACLVVIRV